VLRAILADLNFRNLDDVETFSGQNTTTEFLARVVFERIVLAIKRGDLGPGARAVESLRATLHESHVAWAAYEGPVGDS
jgi:6-pyruvoyltetrahydropterin/6-carboxytetrahydropterin synthase